MAIDTVQGTPRTRGHIIERPRLTALLDETNARTILLVAPAGFGKTTLARQWVAARPHGWYRGSSASADVAALAAGVAQAASALVPGAGKRMMERLGVAGAPPPTPGTLANMLGEDLAGWPADAWLVVDDYHLAMESSASETFVEELMARCPVRLLVTSRDRPTWATARQMLYGEILEVGRGVLALTHEEAKLVLHDRQTAEVAGLMALTEGWPAVIGLASFSEKLALSAAELPDTLYAYCAEELFQKFPLDLRGPLCTIALAPSISVDLLRTLFGQRAFLLAEAAEEGGFLTRAGGSEYDMHPLLRTFLLAKFEEQGPERTASITRELALHLLDAGRWDDALAVSGRTGEPSLLETAIDSALDELIAGGRLETLKFWTARARARGDSPVLDLAEAEVAFREGDPQRALLHAVNGASQLPPEHPRLSRCWFRAGQSAYFLERNAEARELCEGARATATSARDAKDALWGIFNAALDLEDQSAESLLAEVEQLRPLTVSDEVRLAGGRVFYATRWGGLETALARARGLVDRLEGVDPMIQTGFLNSYSHGLILTGRYTEAVAPIQLELARAGEFSLDFVIPHALVLKAWALLGLRRFREAEETIKRVPTAGDHYISVMATLVASRIDLAKGRPDKALAKLALLPRGNPIPSVEAESLATKAVCLAILRRADEAEETSREALETSRTIEAEVLAATARAIAASARQVVVSEKLAREAFNSAVKTGDLDGFVCGYRGFPGLLSAVGHDPAHVSLLELLLARAHDTRLARQAGLHAPGTAASGWALTKREEDVLALIGQGLTNKQIADHLFVAEVTVKVHVRHILRKLGVSSRTQAAVRLATSPPDPSDFD